MEAKLIMVIDDSPVVRQQVMLCLTRAGYSVVCCPDGIAAIRWLLRPDSVTPDLILLDIELPKLNGYEMCQYFKSRARTASIPVVMISRHDGTIDRIRARLCGACWYITKPLNPMHLLSVVKECVS